MSYRRVFTGRISHVPNLFEEFTVFEMRRLDQLNSAVSNLPLKQSKIRLGFDIRLRRRISPLCGI